MKLGKTTTAAIYHFPTRASEWANAMILFNWGVAIYLTGGTVLNGALKPLLGLMRVELWMALFLFLGAGRIALLIINGHLKRTSHYRSAMAFLSCFVWFQVVFAYSLHEQITMAITVYPVLLALDFYNAYRTAIQARVADEGYKQNAGSY